VEWGSAILPGDLIQPARSICTRYDSEGVLWGVVQKDRKRWLVRWTEEGWQGIRVQMDAEQAKDVVDRRAAPGEYPVTHIEMLAEGPDGTIFGLPEFWDPPLQLRGGQYRWHPLVDSDKPRLLYRDAAGKGWLVNGTAEEFFIEGPQEYRPLMRVEEGDGYLERLFFVCHSDGVAACPLFEDALGRYWLDVGVFWDARQHLQGLIVFDPQFNSRSLPSGAGTGMPMTQIHDGDDVQFLPNLPGWDDKQEQGSHHFLYPLSPETFLLGHSTGSGFWQIDTASLTGANAWPEGISPRLAMEAIYAAHDRLYGVAEKDLWMRDDKGWRKILEMIDFDDFVFTYDQEMPRPGLVTERGLWIGATLGAGAIFIPKGSDQPVRFNWERGFPLAKTEVIQRLPDGRLLFAGPNRWDRVFGEDELLAREPIENPRITRLDWKGLLLHDVVGDVWRRLARDSWALFERWEAGSWRSFEPPVMLNFRITDHTHFAFDSRNRLWAIEYPAQFMTPFTGSTSLEQTFAMVFTPPPRGAASEGTWQAYPSFEAALLATWPVQWESPLREGSGLYASVVAGPAGKFAFCTYGDIRLYDGQHWQSWPWEQVTGAKMGIQDVYSCCFITDGKLAVTRGGNYERPATSWRLDPSGSWAPLEEQSLCEECGARRYRVSPKVPKQIQDRFGATWVQRDTLYREGMGLSLPVFPEGAPSPLNVNPTLKGAWATPEGGCFLKAELPGYSVDCCFYISPPQVPETLAKAEATASGKVVLTFETEWDGPLWHTWRIAGRDWAEAVEARSIEIGTTAGEHTVEVISIAEHFAMDHSPCVVQVSAAPSALLDPAVDIQALIEQLNSPDYQQREAASHALAVRGEAALSGLRAARETAQGDLRWWIDTTIAAIEQQAPPATQEE
jgi:hypothetical protein